MIKATLPTVRAIALALSLPAASAIWAADSSDAGGSKSADSSQSSSVTKKDPAQGEGDKDVKKVSAKDAKTPAPPEPPYGKKANESFFQRLGEAFSQQMGTPVYTPPKPGDPPPLRRGQPPPFDGPPYPNGEWQIGGLPTIIGDPGALRDSPYPLMQALYDGPNGKWWYDSRIQIYGWEDFSGNLSTSKNISAKNTLPGPNGNFPEVYDERPNRVEQNQFVFYVERMADEYQTDHIDWGFRYSFVYGLDYRYMITRGFLDSQLLQHNNYYGIDMPMMYFNIYIPWIADGFNVTIGRIISEADIEAQLAPNNLMSSHSLLYGFDPYTDWGIFTTTKLNKNWIFQAGIFCGNDVAPWQSDPGRQATGTVMMQYISDDNKFSVYGGSNAFNNATFGYNNIQQEVITFSYKFNDKVWTSWETWYMYQKNVTPGPTASVPFNNAFYTPYPYSAEWATLDYTMVRLADNTFLTFREEMLDDKAGQRTGFATNYYEQSIGITWWPNKLITIRPELRFDHSFQQTAFDNGTRHNQFTASCDIVMHF